mgnify:CR=1 FL=1
MVIKFSPKWWQLPALFQSLPILVIFLSLCIVVVKRRHRFRTADLAGGRAGGGLSPSPAALTAYVAAKLTKMAIGAGVFLFPPAVAQSRRVDRQTSDGDEFQFLKFIAAFFIHLLPTFGNQFKHNIKAGDSIAKKIKTVFSTTHLCYLQFLAKSRMSPLSQADFCWRGDAGGGLQEHSPGSGVVRRIFCRRRQGRISGHDSRRWASFGPRVFHGIGAG